jgi:hypothetical protein
METALHIIQHGNYTLRYLLSCVKLSIPITGYEGLGGCETSRISSSLDNWFTDGGEVYRITRWPHFTSSKILGTHFC